MKKLMICTVLCWIMTAFCAYATLDGNDSSTAIAKTLPRDLSRRILGVIPSDNGLFLVTTSEEHAPPFETCLRVITCDPNGNVLDQSNLITEGYYIATNDPKIPLIGIHASFPGESKGLWLAEYDKGKLQQKFFLKDKPEEELFSENCWLIEVGGKKKIFVLNYESKDDRPKHWLYCYAMENGSAKLEGKGFIGEGKIGTGDLSVECTLVGREFYVWVCEEGDKWSKGLLRVAKWQNNGELKWFECYKGKKGHLLRGLVVDRLNGSAAAIFGYRIGQWDSLATFCQFEGDIASCADLGSFPSAPTKNQLLHMPQPDVAWILMNYHLWVIRIVALDSKLQITKEIRREFLYTTDLHLVCGSDQAVYIVTVTEDGQIRIEKLKDFAKAKPILQQNKQRDSEELSQEAIADAFKKYRIDELPVVDAKNKPVGLIDVQDIVTLKVVG